MLRGRNAQGVAHAATSQGEIPALLCTRHVEKHRVNLHVVSGSREAQAPLVEYLPAKKLA